MSNNIDLFEHYDKLPKEIQYTIEKYIDADVFTYEDCIALLKDLESKGYTFEYGLDAQPYNLKQITNETI